ncbi:MAG: phosphonate metabolism transcriptional regulator PhnF [Hyphomicrobiales bacterium]
MHIERKSGIAIWRQIADEIRLNLSAGNMIRDNKLLTESELANHFGVNRHTVRAAIAALTKEGLLNTEQGRGTFVQRTNKLRYPISSRTRFSAGLEDQTHERQMRLQGHTTEAASEDVANALGLGLGADTLCIKTVQSADGQNVSISTSWFDAIRFEGIAQKVDTYGSITDALRDYEVIDYRRAYTDVEARHGSSEILDALGLSSGAIALITRALNVDETDRPIQYSVTYFAADRVTLSLESI